MQRACISATRNITLVDLPILPFLAPRVFAPWPNFPKLYRHPRSALVKRYSRPSQPRNHIHTGEEGHVTNTLDVKSSLPGIYVEDLTETFGEDETPLELQTQVADDKDDAFPEQSLGSFNNRVIPAESKQSLIDDSGHGFFAESPNDLRLNSPASDGFSAPTPTGLRSAYPHTLSERRTKGLFEKRQEQWHQATQMAIGLKTPDEFQRLWVEKFVGLVRDAEPGLQESTAFDEPTLAERAKELAKFLLHYEGFAAAIFELWKACLEPTQQTIPFLLDLLHGSPSEALQTLLSDRTPIFYSRLATLQRTVPPYKYMHSLRWHKSDALALIATYLHQTHSEGSTAFDKLYSEVMETLAEHEGLQSVDDTTMYVIIKNCNQDQVATLYDKIEAENLPCQHRTRSHFANFFALKGQYKRTMEVLKQAVEHGADVKNAGFQTICNIALRRSMLSENGYHDNPWIVAAMLDVGIPMNMGHYAVLLVNASEVGDDSTALSTYNLLKEYGQTLSPLVYHTMLKRCMTTLDIDTFRMVREDIFKSEAQSNDFLAGTLLCASYIFLLKDHESDQMFVFHEIVKLYRLIFDTTPLARLQILPASVEIDVSDTRNATSFAVGIMLCAFVRAHMGNRLFDYFMLEKVYRNFRVLVEQGHELVAPIVQTTHASNAFIYAFGHSRSHLKRCLDIVKEMTTPLPPAAVFQGTGHPIQQAQPDVYSWTILINSFSRSGQNAAAKRVMEIMKERGVEPNVVTWNSLTHGYSKSQDDTGLLNSLLDMHESGVSMDSYTLKGLHKFKNKDVLQEVLDQAQTITSSRRASINPEGNFVSGEESAQLASGVAAEL